MGTKKLPNAQLAEHAGINGRLHRRRICGPAHGDLCWRGLGCRHLRRGAPGVHRYPGTGPFRQPRLREGKSRNAAGGHRAYQPVHVPWGLVGGNWMIGGGSFGEALAQALGIPYVLGVGEGISRARYYPDYRKIRVKSLADSKTHKIIGARQSAGRASGTLRPARPRAQARAHAHRPGVDGERLLACHERVEQTDTRSPPERPEPGDMNMMKLFQWVVNSQKYLVSRPPRPGWRAGVSTPCRAGPPTRTEVIVLEADLRSRLQPAA